MSISPTKILTITGIAALACGLDSGVIAATLPYLISGEGYSISQISYIAGAVMAGLFILTPIGGVLVEKFGAKATIILGAALDVTCAPLLFFSHGCYPMMLAGRVAAGAGLALLYVAVPLYLAEALPEERRSKGLGLFNMLVSVGLVAGALAGFLVSALAGPSAEASATASLWAWRSLYLLPAVFAFLLLPSAFLLEDVRAADKAVSNETNSETVGGTFLGAMAIAMFFGAATQLTGISAVLNYPVLLMDKAGLGGLSANGVDIANKGTNAVVSMMAIVLLNRLGCRRLLIIGTTGTFVGLVLAMSAFALVEWFGVAPSFLTGGILAAAFVIFMIFFSFGPGYGVWMILPMMLPSRYRTKGMCVAIFMNYLGGWIASNAFLPTAARIGHAAMFAILASATLVYCLFAVIKVPGGAESGRKMT